MRAQGMTSAGLPRGAQAAAAPAASAPVDLVDRVAKLADLRDRGALTEDEFQAQKKRILGG